MDYAITNSNNAIKLDRNSKNTMGDALKIDEFCKSFTAYMDKICSGQQSCVLDIPKLEEVAQPCPEDFKAYLEASYQCVTGEICFRILITILGNEARRLQKHVPLFRFNYSVNSSAIL